MRRKRREHLDELSNLNMNSVVIGNLMNKNEEDANRSLRKGFRVAAAILFVIIPLYYFRFLDVTNVVAAVSAVCFCMLLMISPDLVDRFNLVKKEHYKFYLLTVFLIMVSILNIFIPKHSMILWAGCIVVTSHYYSPKVTRKVFYASLVLMLVCLYLGMFLGEWDCNLMNASGWDWVNGVYKDVDEFTVAERWNFLLSKINTDNRFLKAFVFYYFPRAMSLILINYIMIALSQRTRRLLLQQINITEKNERMSSELNLATDIQADMLPKVFPPFPDHDEFDIYAAMHPAREVGGDFYDMFMVDDKNVIVVVGDVSGKGVPAALFMVIAKTQIKNHAQLGLSPEEVFTRVNQSICESNEAHLFVTGWLGMLNIETGKLTYVNAGHNPPLIRCSNGNYEYLEMKPNFVMAALNSYTYVHEELQLTPGDRLFLYTDGATEAKNNKNEAYGEGRLVAYLNNHKGDNIRDIVNGVNRDIVEFCNGAEQFDDITMLLLDFRKYC